MTKPLWTSEDMVAVTDGSASGAFSATGISIDTRTLQKGEAYLALKGDALDGHDFVDGAFKAGASVAIVKKDYADEASGSLLRVDDTMTALMALGKGARARTKAKIFAVTGSAGKTGTKEMLLTMLSACGKTHASKKSFNNHWGVPLTLANLPLDAQFGIFEMGMNHKGELETLSTQVRPDIVIITTIEPVHIEHFKSIEEIADAKAEIFLGMGKTGIAVLNIDNPHYARLKTAATRQGIEKILSFGEDEEADAHLVDCTLHASESRVTADILGVRVKYKLSIPGQHIVMNSLAALAAVKTAGVPLAQAIEALKDAAPVTGRGNRISVSLAAQTAPVTIIDESYNANPASMLAAFSVFAMVEPQAGGRRIAVLGDMLELGRDGPRLHADLANPLLKAKADLVFCCGAQMDALYNLLPPPWQGGQAKDSQALAKLVATAARPGDVVLVKGSAGSKMSYVVQALQSITSQGIAS